MLLTIYFKSVPNEPPAFRVSGRESKGVLVSSVRYSRNEVMDRKHYGISSIAKSYSRAMSLKNRAWDATDCISLSVVRHDIRS